MSMINFLKSPFPDNHNGFDYEPKSFTQAQREIDSQIFANERAKSESRLLNMFMSIFK